MSWQWIPFRRSRSVHFAESTSSAWGRQFLSAKIIPFVPDSLPPECDKTMHLFLCQIAFFDTSTDCMDVVQPTRPRMRMRTRHVQRFCLKASLKGTGSSSQPDRAVTQFTGWMSAANHTIPPTASGVARETIRDTMRLLHSGCRHIPSS